MIHDLKLLIRSD